MSDSVSRPMKFPYTLSAKIAQFPFKFHIQNNWIYKYYIYGLIASVPAIIYIHNLSNSSGNKRAFEDAKRKEAEAKHHH